jgi:hypothetical protein
LTLTTDAAIIAKARRIAKRRKTSISAMVANFIASLDDSEPPMPDLPPITRRVLEMGAALPATPKDWDYRDELTDGMEEKYGVK